MEHAACQTGKRCGTRRQTQNLRAFAARIGTEAPPIPAGSLLAVLAANSRRLESTMFKNPALDIPKLKSPQRVLVPALMLVALLCALFAALFSGRSASRPEDEIRVPNMQNVPPPSQKLNLE
jgi:hypothetical protein